MLILTQVLSRIVNRQEQSSVLNSIALNATRDGERGPTISSRYLAYTNAAINDTGAIFGINQPFASTVQQLKGSLLRRYRKLSGRDKANLQEYASAIAFNQINETIGASLFDDQFLENTFEVDEGTGKGTGLEAVRGTDRSARQLRRGLLKESQSAVRNAKHKINGISKSLTGFVKEQSLSIGADLNARSLRDGSNQKNQYADNTDYKINYWAINKNTGEITERPTGENGEPLRNDEIDYNFYDQEWKYKSFNARKALQALGEKATVSEDGSLIVENPSRLRVNPGVRQGETGLTTAWQSITAMGIFPTKSDGGTQEPLTPQWRKFKPILLNDYTKDLRPAKSLNAFKNNGKLNKSFVNQNKELVELSRKLQADSPGSDKRRAKAEFWELGDGTLYPTGYWQEEAIGQVNKLNLKREKTNDLLSTLALGQSMIAAKTWDIKYKNDYVRPFTSVNEIFLGSKVGDWRSDDQIANVDDKNQWRAYQLRRNQTPPFPEHYSGHSSFSALATTILRISLGGNTYDESSPKFVSRFVAEAGFDGDLSNGNEQSQLQWNYFSEASDEAGRSRQLGGIHFRRGNIAGIKQGITLGHATLIDFGVRSETGKPAKSKTIEDNLPRLRFGTFKKDKITGLPSKKSGEVEMYGFRGNDKLISINKNHDYSADEEITMFGGHGSDSFIISMAANGSPNVRIADLEPSEDGEGWKDKIVFKDYKSPKNIKDFLTINKTSSPEGLPYSEISFDDLDISLQIDGDWTKNHLLNAFDTV